MNKIKSWDCFDTLIARTNHDPGNIFTQIGVIINDPNFYQKRITAERFSTHKTLEDIYTVLGPKYDKDLELLVEKNNLYPIKCNFDMVADGDIVISDMYLSSKQIKDLLCELGLDKDITVYSTYGGKHQGWIWDKIKASHDISVHIGDNLHADVVHPRQHGINTSFFNSSNMSNHEEYLSRTSIELANLCRKIRLSNPYHNFLSLISVNNTNIHNVSSNYWIEETDGKILKYKITDLSPDRISLQGLDNNKQINILSDRTVVTTGNQKEIVFTKKQFDSSTIQRKIIWDDQSNFNLPILLGIIKNLPKHDKVLFSMRDCYYLYLLYSSIYIENNASLLHVNRKSYNNPYNAEYIKYLKDSMLGALLVDMNGCGGSLDNFLTRHNGKSLLSDALYVSKVGHHNNYIKFIVDTTQCNIGTTLEKQNTPHAGYLTNWINNHPVRIEGEHDQNICDAMLSCIQFAASHAYLSFDKIDIPIKKLQELMLNLSGTYTDTFVTTIGN